VVISGSTEAVGRAELLKKLADFRVIDRFEADRFIGGHPLHLISRTDEPSALAMAEKLRVLGAVVSVEPSPPMFSLPSDISLVSLDGDGEVAEPAPVSDVVAVEPARPKPPLPDEARFDAPRIAETVMELEHPVAAPKAAPSPAPLAVETALPIPFEPDPRDEPDEDDAPFTPIPGRLMQGRLQRQPGLRMALGVALGLLIGYVLSAPYQSRSERRVAQIRAQANVDRFRPVDEARANAARLDEEADDLNSSAFAVTLVIWLGSAGAVVAGWYRFT
jgi:hypothetical protein